MEDDHLKSLKYSVMQALNLTEEQVTNLYRKYLGEGELKDESYHHQHVDVVAHADVHDAAMPHQEILPTQVKETKMTDGIKDDVNIHNIIKEAGGSGGMGLGGIGGGVLGGLLASRLFGRGEGEGRGAETHIEDTVFNTAVLNKLGTIEASIPYNEAQVQLALAATQNALTTQATTNANATALATGGVKDAVQNTALLTLQGLSENKAATLASQSAILSAICESTNTIVSKIDGNTIAMLQAELAESRNSGRSREMEVNVTQNVNQNQAQAQAQVQLQNIGSLLGRLVDNHQDIRQGIVNLGTMVGNNSQTAANTRVY